MEQALFGFQCNRTDWLNALRPLRPIMQKCSAAKGSSGVIKAEPSGVYVGVEGRAVSGFSARVTSQGMAVLTWDNFRRLIKLLRALKHDSLSIQATPSSLIVTGGGEFSFIAKCTKTA